MKKISIVITVLFFISSLIQAQTDTLYVIKANVVIGKYNIKTQLDSIIFYEPTNLTNQALNTPSNLKATKGLYSNKIIVNWSLVPNIQNYQLYRFNEDTGDYTLLLSTDKSTIDDSTFNISSRQYYKVRSVQSESLYSNFSNIDYGFSTNLILNNPKIDRPILFKISKGTYGNKITLTWSKTPNAHTYQIYKFNQNLNKYDLFTSTTDTLYEDKTITSPYSKVFYKIRIFNSDTEFSNFTDVDYGYTSGKVYDLVSQFGSQGSGAGQFSFPEHLSIDKNDNIYVSDNGNNQIIKYSKNGVFIENFYSCSSPRSMLFLSNMIVVAKSADNKIYEINYNKQFIREWGSSGTGDSQFGYFRQITADNDDNIYVVDHNNSRIQKFDLNGNFISKWGNNGETAGNFVYPWGIAYINNQIIVSAGTRVQFFTKDGTFIKQWDLGTTVYDIRVSGNDIYLACGGYVLKTTENRDFDIKIGENDFELVTSMVIDSNNNLYTNDVYKRKISLYKMN